MPGSMGTPGLQTGRAGFFIHPEKGLTWCLNGAWVGDSSANTAGVANTYMLLVRTAQTSAAV